MSPVSLFHPSRFRIGVAIATLAVSGLDLHGSHNSSARVAWWGAVDFGAGSLKRSLSGVSESDNRFYMNFTVGYTLHPQFLAGIELGGWLYEASNLWWEEQTKGEGVMQVLAVARWYPSPASGMHLQAGAGLLDHWKNRPEGGTGRNSGFGYEVGLGYDFPQGDGGWSVTPHVLVGGGKAGAERFTAVTLAVGLTWH